MFLCCINFSYAQSNAANLPSLIYNQKNIRRQNNNADIEALLRQKMFVKVFTNKNKIFVGEPLMVTYKFYVASHINDRPSVSKQPEFSGWSVKELNFDQGPEFEKINNETYSVYTIRKVQLTPLQEGSFSLGKAYVSNAIEVFNPDDVMLTKKFNIVAGNSDVFVQVNNLPENGRPENFYGITGNFSIRAAAEKNKIPVGENGRLIVTVKGAGNLDAIVEPEIAWPANIEHFNSKDSQHVDENNFPVSGDRVFEIPFISKQQGRVTIPSIKFSFFNTTFKKYETVATDSIPVTFIAATSAGNSFKQVIHYDITNRKYLWIVPAIAFTVILVGFISYRRNKKNILNAKPAVNTTALPVFTPPQPAITVKYRTDFSKYLSELKAVTDNKTFFTKSKSLLTKAVAEKLGSTQYSEQVLMDELIKQTCNAPVCNKAVALYEAINVNLYAPFETPADLDFYFIEIKQVVSELQAE